jgi:hypothetical protein
MALSLGPMPENLRSIVRRWIEEGGEIHDKVNALFIGGGPGGCSYLAADGEVWDWSVWDDSISRVEDGPGKVLTIAVAADLRPELAEWLPRRPPSAADCLECAGRGWLPFPRLHPGLRCPQCSGLGWCVPDDCP